MAEILHFEILRKHGQTHRQTWALQYLALPLWGRGNYQFKGNLMHLSLLTTKSVYIQWYFIPLPISCHFALHLSLYLLSLFRVCASFHTQNVITINVYYVYVYYMYVMYIAFLFIIWKFGKYFSTPAFHK